MKNLAHLLLASAGFIFSSQGAPIVTTDVVHEKAVEIKADLKGAKELFLVVTDAGDGFVADWAEWIEPTLLKGDGSRIKLTELKPKISRVGFGTLGVNARSDGAQPMRVSGRDVAFGLAAHAPSLIGFDLPEGVVGFEARGGIDEGGTRQGGGATVTFQVYATNPGENVGAINQSGQNNAERYGFEKAKANMATMKTAAGLHASLFASEPMIQNPTNIDIDHRGRVWAVEAVDYRLSLHKNWDNLRPEGDRVVILEDTNGDGVADKETNFFQSKEMQAPLGICVLPQADGSGTQVLVSAAPNLWLLTDTDGDDHADKSEILLKVGGSWDHDHQLHAFTFGPDGKFYFNFGNETRDLKWPDGSPVKDLAGNSVAGNGKPYRQGMALRCDFVNGKLSNIETLGWNFRNNYEVCVDSFGTLWQSDNDDDGNKGVRINYVMEYGNYGYTDEITGAGWSVKRTNLEPEIPRRHWHLNDPGVVPTMLLTGQGSPTGILFNEGTALGPQLTNQIIHCDAGPRIVRAYVTKPDGAGYNASIVDVLGSGDSWYRPADLSIAPDGSLFVADWYDAGVGGHNMADRKPGTIMGRIYRLVATPSAVGKLDLTTASGAVTALRSPNAARRFMGWQALHAMGSAAENELLALWKDPNPHMRARALGLLSQIKGRETKYLGVALADANSDLRVFAVRLGRMLATSHGVDTSSLEDNHELMAKLMNDPSPAVRRQLAVSLHGSKDGAKRWTSLAMQHDGKDRWYLEALGIGARGNDDACFNTWLAAVGDKWNSAAGRDIIWRVRSAKAASLLAKILQSRSTVASEAPHYLRAFDFLPTTPEKTQSLVELASLGKQSELIAAEALSRLKDVDLGTNPKVKAALDAMLTSSKGTGRFVELVRDFKIQGQGPAILEFIVKDPASPDAVEATKTLLQTEEGVLTDALKGPHAAKVVEALGNTADARALALLQPLMTDEGSDLQLRKAATKALTQSQAGIASLITLAKNGQFPEPLKFSAATALAAVQQAKFKKEVAEFFPLPNAAAGHALPPLPELVKRKGDAGRGKALFAKAESTCVTCHKVGTLGVDVGPALSEIGSKLGKDALYESILAPNAGISMGFETTQVSLNNGDAALGIVRSETAEELVMVMPGGIQNRYKKTDITKRDKLPTSLMPAGLQALMSTQDLVDLIEYLGSLKK